MAIIDEQYTKYPSSGSRTMMGILWREGYPVGRNRVRRLMSTMGIVAVYPKPRTSIASVLHKKYPYLLRGLLIDSPNLVWCMDITYIRMLRGFVYLAAVMDWHSRYVLGWRLSNTMDCAFCLEAVQEAFNRGRPKIFNTDQGVQFTSDDFTSMLELQGIRISMDGKGRYMDNIFIERLWRSVKYDVVYLRDYSSVPELFDDLSNYFDYYNHRRPHQGLAYSTPSEVYLGQKKER